MKKSLKTSVMLTWGVIFVIIFANCTLVSDWLMRKGFSDAYLETATAIANYFALNMEEFMLRQGDKTREKLLSDLKGWGKIGLVRILSGNGSILYSSREEELKGEKKAHPEELKNPVLEKGGSITHQEGDYIGIIKPIRRDRTPCRQCHDPKNEPEVYLEVHLPLQPITKANRYHKIVAFISCLSAILISLSLWLKIYRKKIDRPLKELIQQMALIKDGDLSARASIAGEDEFSYLAQSFNTMVEQLGKSRETMDYYHRRGMEQASQMANLGELATSIAHEIKNPLIGIRRALEIVANDIYADRKEHGKVMEMIKRELERLQTNVETILTYARPTTPKKVLGQINEVLNQVLNLIKPAIQEANVALEQNLDPDLPPVEIDTQQVSQIFLNILVNAIQAMPGGGKLSLKTRLKLGNISVEVKDTGIGVEEDKLGRIFRPFYTTKHRGTGLGLTIVQKFMEQHGGSISMESKPGKGTTVTLLFPCGTSKPTIAASAVVTG